MAKRKILKSKLPQPKLSLRDRIEIAAEETEVEELEGGGLRVGEHLIGPLGNLDFVQFGSEQHATILGFVPGTDLEKTVFDDAVATPAQLEAFVERRKKYLKAEIRPVEELGYPLAWNPDAEPGVKVLT